MKNTINRLQYPIGKCVLPDKISRSHIDKWVFDIVDLHSKLGTACQGLSGDQYLQSYRPGGWTIKQILFHLTDSHTHSYIRFKWAMTEDRPLIKAYKEARWAVLKDVDNSDINEIFEEIAMIQKRLVRVITSLTDEDLKKAFVHPESGDEISLAELVGHYAWHGNHHLEHIKIATHYPATGYVPISCAFYDELVLLAMRKTKLKLIRGKEETKGIYVKDIITSRKEEYILFSDGSKERLDNIKKLEGLALYLD